MIYTDPEEASAGKQWNHWFKTFENFLHTLRTGTAAARTPVPEDTKLQVLINYVAPNVFELISECETYTDAVDILKEIYEKKKSDVFSRHLLQTRKQQPGETLDQYLQALKILAKDCKFEAVTANKYKDESVRDAFINGLQSNYIRQRLFELKDLDLQTACTTARSLEMAHKHADSYLEHGHSHGTHGQVAAYASKQDSLEDTESTVDDKSSVTAAVKQKCFFCGFDRHPRNKCPAKDSTCNNCSKTGHWAKCCRSNPKKSEYKPASIASVMLATVERKTPKFDVLKKTKINLNVGGVFTKNCLIDSGSSDSFIDLSFAKKTGLQICRYSSASKVTMASTEITMSTLGTCCTALIQYGDYDRFEVKLGVIDKLCADVILGLDILEGHESVELRFGGPKAPLRVCSVATAAIEPPPLFASLSPDCKPIADKSRYYSEADRTFIAAEVEKLLEAGIIEESRSPWRAQVLVTGGQHQKRRMVIDYSRTINRFTELDAYPLPNISSMARSIAEYSIYSTFDLKSAYHQLPIKEEEKKFTAFEANGKLYQMCRVPFGVTNGVSCFQRTIDRVIQNENLKDTYAYVDNITVCGKDKETHDANVERLRAAASKYHLTFNEEKTISSVSTIQLLGYAIEHGKMKPDPDRLKPLKDLPAPTDAKSLKRVIGLFSYYSQWIPRFSEIIHPLVTCNDFPLTTELIDSFNHVKSLIEDSVVTTIQKDIPLVVETDASEHSVAASLNQAGKPVAFFSRSLSPSEQRWHAVEKEACAIVEALQKWRHYLLGSHFQIITDQQALSFMYDSRKLGKIKNEKIARWRIEMSPFKFEILHRPGKANCVADTLTRNGVSCNSIQAGNLTRLSEIHNLLCHPGVARLSHFVRARNLPFSVEEVKKITQGCAICAEVKPRFYRPPEEPLIKATRPFDRLSIDFKGPLPTVTKNSYLLTIVDEYTRFPFAYPCAEQTADVVIQCLNNLFSIFGMPSFIHSDRGAAFMSDKFRRFLVEKGVAQSRTTPYNPTGNSQCERFNGIIWKTVRLATKSRDLPIQKWEEVLPDVLHSLRSLLSTATNATPHERLFSYPRKSMTGSTLPTWLLGPGKVLYRRQVRQTKEDPLVDEVELLEANTQYAHVRFPGGCESTVSTKYLAPTAEPLETPAETTTQPSPHSDGTATESSPAEEPLPVHRRSTRTSRAPQRLNYSTLGDVSSILCYVSYIVSFSYYAL